MEEQALTGLLEIIKRMGADGETAVWIHSITVLIIIAIIAVLANLLTKKVLLTIIARIIKKSKNQYDDIFVKKKVFDMLSHIVPAIIFYYGIDLVTQNGDVAGGIQALTSLYMIVVIMLVVNSFLNSMTELYEFMPISKSVPIKGYVQVLKIVFYFIGAIIMFSIILGKTPGTLFAGLGAMAAVLMLIFKDTILGFVASIQLSAFKMMKPGDWISMPSRKADGIVMDINVSTVKVQNWDKTYSQIPTYAFVSESFKNWIGMDESGGRRIKRAISIDMTSVELLSDEMIDKFRKIHLLTDYIDKKVTEVAKYNDEKGIDGSIPVNGRRLTNIGTFRMYMELYLKDNPLIRQDLTFLVRQLQPDHSGIPIEIYLFSKDQRWAAIESLQSDIFDHFLAILPEFGLRVFQNPTGYDFHTLRKA